MSRRITRLLLAASLAATSAVTAKAQDWPSKPISMVVPYAAGGGTDVIARAVALKLQERLGVGVVVENRAGAGGNLGTTAAAQAPADGYTVLISNIGPMAVNPSLFKNLKYDPAEVLEPVTLIAKAPLLLLVHTSVKANSVAELIALAKDQPEGLTYGTAGHGSANHIATALFELTAKVKLKHAAYRGAGPALNDLLGGHIPMMFATLPSAIGHVNGGGLKALAVTTAERAPALPQVPTLAEAGVPGYEASGWYGVFVRKGTPQAIIDKLRSEVATIINLPDVRRNLELEGAQPIGNTPTEFAAFVKAEREKWSKVVAEADIKVE
ncbi:Bug family tripartite tricarboxylate transporter substrate binding protein [Bosea sp. Root483D1]|uniref:Bug family tripartite tricarboxylate transporter substrate binding protein n=1 Tax=Bosea sp. Root483D1 TaxID=1736544 RepID=UPI000AD46FF3|nr:tripartite tricarboxylate transporter substrate binding protein [Bosea sp. Root483D1]